MDAPPKRRLPSVPWALVIALGVYYALVAAYVQYTYWSSPEYLAAQHLASAQALLGPDDGRGANQVQLDAAYGHLLEAARLMPGELWIQKQLENLNARFELRGWKVPLELRRRADAVAIVSTRIAEEKKPIMAVGARDRGWDPESLLNGPGRTFAWSLVGAFGIVVVWAYARFNEKRRWQAEREQELQRQEKAVEELGAYRKRGGR